MRITAVIGRAVREFWLNSILGSPALPVSVRAAGLRRAGLHLGRDVKVSPGQRFVAGYDVVLGESVFINEGCLFDGQAPIRIGKRVRVAPRAQFLTSSHEVSADPSMRAGDLTYGPITVEDGCWVGAGVIVLSGVRIAAGCVIAAGAVVTRSTEPNGLYAGCPARRVRDL